MVRAPFTCCLVLSDGWNFLSQKAKRPIGLVNVLKNQAGETKLQVKRLMPCTFTGPKMFCAGPSFLCQPKNLTAFSATSKTFVLAQKPILQNANHPFVLHKMFVTATICK